MRRKTEKGLLAVSLAAALTVAAIGGNVWGNDRALAAEETVENENIVEINSRNVYSSNHGIFEGWGTSLCWFGNRIGGSEKTSNEAAKLLCNEEDGLGLNIIRFNIGGGDDPSHDHITRTDSKMPGYWGTYDEATDTFTYDYTKDANQRNVLKKMQAENGNLTVEAFSNSAPYFMTVSGCTSGVEDGFADNLKADKFDDFAEYMANVVKYYKTNYGVNFTSVEPMNENGWSIQRNGQKQEGCTFKRGESQSKMLLAMSAALKNHGLDDVVLAGCDESTPGEALSSLNKLSEEALNVLGRVDTHTYGEGKEDQLRAKVQELSKNLWMSETDGGDTAGKNAGEMGAALALAQRINHGMNSLQPSAWILWQAIGSYCSSQPYEGNRDPVSLNQSDLDKKGFWGVTYADMDKEQVVLTKKYYAFGQYTKYIHKGDYMLVGNDQNTISYDKEKKELKIVAMNTTDTEQEKQYNLSGFDVKDAAVEVVRTSGDLETGENWKKVEGVSADSKGFQAVLKPNSITTFIVKNTEADLPVIESSATPAITPSDTPQASAAPSAEPQKAPALGQVKQVKVTKTGKTSVALSWKKVSGAKYKVAYSTDKKKLSKIKNGTAKAVSGTKIKASGKNKITLKGLKKSKTYYVKVCAYQVKNKKTVYGNYSAVKKCKTKK